MLLGTMTAAIFANSVAVEAAAGRTAKTVTAYGDAQVDTAQYKFGGASAYFDGTGDYLYAADPNGDFLFGTSSDFTIEFWYKKPDTGVTHRLASNRGGYVTGNWYIQFDHTTDKIQWGVNGASAQRSTNTFDDTNWHHLALVRSGNDFKLFIDGASENTLTGSYQIGRSGDDYIKFGAISTLYGNVHIDEIRVSDTARYTTGFTPSTTAFSNDSNTLLLIHADGTDGATNFVDDNGDRAPLGVTAFNDAQVDTAQSKFGGASMLLDGSDYVEFDIGDSNWGSGDFTIEFWYRPNTLSGVDIIWDGRRESTSNTPVIYWQSNIVYRIGGSDVIITSSSLSTGTWYHIAVVKSSGTTKVYVDGTQSGISYSDSTTYTAGLTRLGNYYASTGFGVDGHLDEIRVSSVARYTTSFTPSTSAFSNDSDTILLIHADGADTSTDFVDDNGAG